VTLYRRHRRLLTILASAAATIVLALLLVGKSDEFETALSSAPLWMLALATLLQVVALLTRTEAWMICIREAGGTVPRRRIYRASSWGVVGGLANAQLGVAARIAALRKSAPRESPRIAPLIGAEVPIMAVEATLGAIASLTLIGPLGLPWWSPIIAIAVAFGLGAGLRSFALRSARGIARGLAVLKSFDHQVKIVAIMLVAVFAQIGRNWLLLYAVGVSVSPLDATALLIAQTALSQLPLGPAQGATAAVLILGANGVAVVAAAGVLLSATGLAGGLVFAAWAGVDRLWCTDRARALRHRVQTRRRRSAAQILRERLATLSEAERRIVERAYFGGLSHLQIAHALRV
jgi:uncharacterized membrane protein YbhN (UPF0104 family)